ncbi:bcl-2-like protein 10 [Anolis carolinensis]|uniref:bcl-2-like protein 10 n=1 Tax=Anolis carolinensis TaxID=28377 RepID=UPI002F2B26FF
MRGGGGAVFLVSGIGRLGAFALALLAFRRLPPSASGATMAASLSEETARLVGDYLAHRLGVAGRPPSRAAETLRRVADELERRERSFFRSAASGALQEAGGEEAEAAAGLVWRVAAQMELPEEGEAAAAAGGLNWGRVVALVVFAGNVAAALVERGEQGPAQAQAAREALSEALSAYLAVEKRAWMEEHGGWDGFYHFFNRRGSDETDQNSTISNAIMAAAGFGLAGLAFLLAVR